MRTILAIVLSVLFFPIAVLLGLGVGLISVPDIIDDFFTEVRGK